MTLPPDNEHYRFGSSRYATEDEVARAGMFDKGPDSLFVGFLNGRRLYYSGAAGAALWSGPRGGKLACVTAFNLCQGGFEGTLVVLDPKAECGSISRLQTRKKCYYWNPHRLNNLPYHRINPVDYIRRGSLSLVPDVQELCLNILPPSGSANSSFFERRARQYLQAIILTIVRIDGVLTLPRLYRIINLIPGGGDEWLDFAFEMHEANPDLEPETRAMEEDIATSRQNESGGFRGILGELMAAFSALSDPALLASFSPPYDFSLEDLCASEPCHFYILAPENCLETWANVIKTILVGAKIYKGRNPSAPRQTWLLDEIAQVAGGGFPLAVKLFTIGAGLGIRPWCIFQSLAQLKALAPHAESNLPAGAGLRQFFGIRDEYSASSLSRQLGTETLEYSDTRQQAAARLAREEALQQLLHGGDPVRAALALAHHGEMETHRSQQQRWLRNMDEVIGTPNDRQFIFADGLSHPIYAERAPYWEQRFMAGRFHPNPFHPPHDRVRIKTLFGHDWRRIVTERVPAHLTHLPQYADGYWSYVEGFR